MMNEFSLWLQEEVNCSNINDYLYLHSLKKIKNKVDVLSQISVISDAMIRENFQLESLMNYHNVELIVTSDMQKNVHATFNPNDNTIKINKEWIEFLSRFMSEDNALQFCLSHEIAHVIEDDEIFNRLKRRERTIAYEVLAVMFSHKYSQLSYHPYLYEYYYGIENNLYSKEALISFLKGA